ncbi:MAG: hypothetical protein ABWY03_06810 [Microbacterium sp.]
MEPIFSFVGDYWWLVFPLMGVLGAAGSAWERGARRRHKRRLEVLHAKAELKAAARGTAPIPVTAAKSSIGANTAPKPASVPQGTQLERLFASHDAVTARWLEYELDVAKIIAFPAMSDGRQPLTAAFLRAKRIADGLRPASAKAKLTKEQLAEYRNAVADFEVAFDIAERDARRLKDSSFTEVERKRLDTAKNLLSIAVDQAATPAERQLAYKRVREELDGLISLSDDAIEVLEIKVALQLDATATDAAAPPTPETAPEKRPAPGAREHAPWPVPARNSDTAPGRVIHPKSHS